jgi:outer membrane protein assembly factor BamE (lipoprotein component of BamABCDE complex)
MKQMITRLLAVCFVLLTAACTGYAPTDRMLGNSREQIIRVLGTPSTEKAIPDGQVLIYPRGPFGKHTYFVYLNEDGNMTRWTQVLDEKNFARIKPGMHRDEVVSIIGESKIRDGIAFGRGYVWSWRYVNFHCFWFRAEFTPEDTVRSTMYQKPPECRLRR